MTAPDLAAAAAPRSDQLNADDLIGGPRIVTITEVRRGNADQPVEIVTEEFGPGRPYRPGKSMIRVLLETWGPDAPTYTGRKLMLYRDPEIRFGGQAVGGIRISAMSHIDQRQSINLTVTRGRRAPFVVEPLAAGPQLITDKQADDFLDTIHKAQDQAALSETGKQLKTFDLGVYKVELQTAWSARSAELKQPVQGAIDDQEQAS
jgi:hypothetical protein